MAHAASRENVNTNVRFNEVYLAVRVEVDEEAEKHGVTKASDFAKVYIKLLERQDVRSSRVWIRKPSDIDADLVFEAKQ